MISPFLFILGPRDLAAPTRRELVGAVGVLCALNILAGWMLVPLVIDTLPPGVRSSTSVLTIVLLWQAAMLLCMVAVRWSVMTYIAWSVGAATGASERWRPYLAVFVLADAVLVIRELTMLVIIWLRWPGDGGVVEAPKIGLNLLFDNLTPAINAALNQVNVFSVWHALVVVIGLQAFAGVSRRTALATVVLMWTTLIAAGIALPRLIG